MSFSSNSQAKTSPCHQEATVSSIEDAEIPSGAKSDSLPHAQYQGPCYPSAYISVVQEHSTNSQSSKVTELLKRYCSENPDCPVAGGHLNGHGRKSRGARGGGKSPEGGEGYEKATARHGDRAFLKFQKELSRCPQQIIRQEIYQIYNAKLTRQSVLVLLL